MRFFLALLLSASLAFGQGGVPVTKLSQLRGDVNVTSITTGQVLKYSSPFWVNAGLGISDISGLSAQIAALQPLNANLTTIAGLTATTDSFIQAKGSAWSARTIAQVKTDLGLPQTTITGNAATATALATGRTISVSTDATGTSASFDGTGNATIPVTLATVNGNVGTFGSATQSAVIALNGKGLATSASNITITPAIGSITGLGSGVATFLATPSSANLAGAITNETGTGLLPFATQPTFTTGINISGSEDDNTMLFMSVGPAQTGDLIKVLVNGAEMMKLDHGGNLYSTFFGSGLGLTNVPLSSITGFGTGIATALAINTGSAGAPVLFNGAGGTPSSMTGTNISGTASSLTTGHVTTNANLTGDVTSSGNATTLAAGNAGNLNSGNLADARNTVSNSTTTTMSGLTSATITTAPAANTVGTALLITDTTAASSGNQQYSGAARWTSQGWKTTSTAASQAVDFRAYVVPVQGTTNPTGLLTFDSSVNGGAFGNSVTIDTTGNFASGTGTATTPAYGFTGTSGTGLYRDSSANLGFTRAGTTIFLASASGVECKSTLGYCFSSPGVALYSGFFQDLTSPMVVCLRNGTTAQTFTVANTWASTTSFERFTIDWTTNANACFIGTIKGSGGGSARALNIGTDGTTAIAISTAQAVSIPQTLAVTGTSTLTGAVTLSAVPRFNGTNTTGAGVTAVGTNCPAVTPTAPYTWIQATSSDGSTVYIPAWK